MGTELPNVVSRETWLAARKELLAKEKELTKARDAVNAERRRLPMVKIDKEYVFEGPKGRATLLDLFEGRNQLIVDHAMWLYELDEEGRETETPRVVGCPSCSFRLDNLPHLAHLNARGTTLAVVSRAPLDTIEPFKKRMGWTFPWYSSHGSDFNYDFHVTVDDRVAPIMLNYQDINELEQAGFHWSPARRGDYPALSAFLRDGENVYHTYSTYGRGTEQTGGTSYFLDLTALGRQEEWEEPKGSHDGPRRARRRTASLPRRVRHLTATSTTPDGDGYDNSAAGRGGSDSDAPEKPEKPIVSVRRRLQTWHRFPTPEAS